MVAIAPATEAMLERAFPEGRIRVRLTKLPTRLRLSMEAAADLVAQWQDGGLVEVWGSDPGGPSAVLTTLARSRLNRWDEDDISRRKDATICFSDLGRPANAAGLVEDWFEDVRAIEPGAALASAEDEHERKRAGKPSQGAWNPRNGVKLQPLCGLSAPWGPAEIARHRYSRPKSLNQHTRRQPAPACPACMGVDLGAVGHCVVCDRSTLDPATRPIEEAPVEAKTIKFRPRVAGARLAVANV